MFRSDAAIIVAAAFRGERDIFAHDGDKNPFITIVSEPSLSNPGAGPVLSATGKKKIIIPIRKDVYAGSTCSIYMLHADHAYMI